MYSLDDASISALITELKAYKEYAYVPYSRFPVCALIIDDQQKKYFGVNVENASYGLTLCAERGALMTAVAQGMKSISFLAVAADSPKPVTPCGACRQMIAEFALPQTPVVCANFAGKWTAYSFGQLLPEAFTSKDFN